MLGIREPDIYGSQTMEDIHQQLAKEAADLGMDISFYQSNSEGALVDRLQAAYGQQDGVILNPAAYTNTSIALYDAIKAVSLPVIEVHLSNIHAREEMRWRSLLAPACLGQIAGLGSMGYSLALLALYGHLNEGR